MTERDFHSMASSEAKSGADNSQVKSHKKAYARPQLTRYGDVRTMTLAPTPEFSQESGFAYLTRNPGSP